MQEAPTPKEQTKFTVQRRTGNHQAHIMVNMQTKCILGFCSLSVYTIDSTNVNINSLLSGVLLCLTTE